MPEINDKKIVTRIAPSPTGVMHVGTARTALYNALFARQNNGVFLVRIEDTDSERSEKRYEQDILEGLSWLGLHFDDLSRQSQRADVYERYLNQLIADNKAYISKEEKDGKKSEVIRFRNPGGSIVFDDMIRGRVEMDVTDLGDFVIAKSVHRPLYHIAVVVDDHEMDVTHVIRGDDGIANTPRQILLQSAIGAKRPIYAHIPLILAPDRSKLSKRHGAVSLSEFKAMGILPEALLNYLALLGWNPGTDQEIFSVDELVDAFNLSKVQKGGAIFSLEKLRWINREHILKLPKDEQEKLISERLARHMDKDRLSQVLPVLIPLILEKISTFQDIDDMFENGEFTWLSRRPDIEQPALLVGPKYREESSIFHKTADYLEHISVLLSNIPEDAFTKEGVKEKVWMYAEEIGKGKVLWPLRYALCGMERSPDPFTLACVLGKKETLERVLKAKDELLEV